MQWDESLTGHCLFLKHFSAYLPTLSPLCYLFVTNCPTRQNKWLPLKVWSVCSAAQSWNSWEILLNGFLRHLWTNLSTLVLNGVKGYVVAWLIDCELLKMGVPPVDPEIWIKVLKWNEITQGVLSQLSGMFSMPNIKCCNISITFQPCMILQSVPGAWAADILSFPRNVLSVWKILNKTTSSGEGCSSAPCRGALLAPTFPKQCGGWLLRVQPDGSSSLPSLLSLLKSQDQSPSNNRATWLDLQRWAVISAPSHVSMELECHQSHERYPIQELHSAGLLPGLSGDKT